MSHSALTEHDYLPTIHILVDQYYLLISWAQDHTWTPDMAWPVLPRAALTTSPLLETVQGREGGFGRQTRPKRHPVPCVALPGGCSEAIPKSLESHHGTSFLGAPPDGLLWLLDGLGGLSAPGAPQALSQ